MQIAIVEDNKIISYGELNELFPNVSFPIAGPEAAWMNENNVKIVEFQLPYNPDTQKLISTEVYIENSKVYSSKVVDLTSEELDVHLQQLANQARGQRNMLLSQTDWTALTDTVLSSEVKQQYEVYRQTLRDITLQEGFPKTIVWPLLNLGGDLLSTSMGSGSVM